ncbi:L-2-amino-thiazoline-4-carboxylic acid hydrolase [Streptomyces sp. NPDC059063]|uniref:L-2-amino-thiazoline-4-carboxylic acid hydrolase n=1 Tax=unclassified Streptomyces TaxID=2593676 RepID=UPI00367BDD5F
MTTDHYVPDPEADTAAVIDGFFGHIAATLRELPDSGLLAAMRARHEELTAANRHLVVDEAALYNLRMTLALVAAYEFLMPSLGRRDALDLVRTAFVEPLSEAVRQGTRAMLDSSPDPYRAMVDLAKSREQHAFGAGFAFRHPVDDDSRFFADVHRCFYHQVLVANSAPELTPVMCAFDANWIEAIDPHEHGFRFERVTTIGLGGTHCPFHFLRTRAAHD